MFKIKSVECYDPSLNTWKLVAELFACRNGVGVGVLDGLIYAIGSLSELVYILYGPLFVLSYNLYLYFI